MILYPEYILRVDLRGWDDLEYEIKTMMISHIGMGNAE